jgi:hypothetical protein
VIIAILAAIPFCLGKYFEFNSPDPYDSGMNVYSAKHVLEGARIGIDTVPSAKLGTLLVNMLGVWLFGFNETGPKFLQMLFQAAALVLMFVAMCRLFGILPAAVAVIVASVYLSSPAIAKFGNVKEQHMIGLMVIGASCFVIRQLGGKWWWAVLAGAFLSWAPLFKETGTSVIGAIGLFVIVQPLLKHRTWKQTGVDILFLLAGVVAAIGPLYIWIIGWDVQTSLPYSFVWKTVAKLLPFKGAADVTAAGPGYLGGSRKLIPFSTQWPRVLRYYWLLRVPIALALISIVARLVKMVHARLRRSTDSTKPACDRFVLLLAIWWILDMAFVWISPRSYEQYYLPLNASAAMLGGYAIALYWGKARNAVYKGKWIVTGLAAVLLMVVMSWHIFFGVETSPHTGGKYGQKKRGYAQKFGEIRSIRKNTQSWQAVGDYIRINSSPSDKMYVWAWYPGIYVRAQRFSAASKACLMPRPVPAKLAEQVDKLLVEFTREKPKFIVDSRKLHIPTNRPPYELWPIAPKGFGGAQRPRFLPNSPAAIEAYDKAWSQQLAGFGEEEVERYRVLAPLRKFVMDNYQIGQPQQFVMTGDPRFKLWHRMFGQHVLFQLKESAADREPQ